MHTLAKVLAGTATASEIDVGSGVVGDPFVAAKLANPCFKCLSCDKPVALIPSWRKEGGDAHRITHVPRATSLPTNTNNVAKRRVVRPKSASASAPRAEPAGELLVASDEVITAGRSSFAGDRPRSASANAPGGGGYKPRRHNSLMRPGGRLAPGSNDWKETGEYKRTYVPHSTKSRALVRSKSAGGAAKRASPGVSRHLFASVVQDAVNAKSTSPLN